MLNLPNSCKDLVPSASLLFVNLRLDTAAKVLEAGSIPVLGDLLSEGASDVLGVARFNAFRAARRLPRPWAATVGEFVPLPDDTPRRSPATPFAAADDHEAAAYA